MEKKVQRNFLWIALLVLGTIWILARHNRTQPYYTVNGLIFGTVYNITYQYDDDLKAEIDEELKKFDGSLSPFNDTATITRINRNEDIVPDTFFTNVFRRSIQRNEWCIRYYGCSTGQCLGVWFQERRIS